MSELLCEIKQLIVEVVQMEDLRTEDIADDAPLFGDDGLGLDSIDALELGVALRKRYQVRLDKGDSSVRAHFRSARALAEFVQDQRAAGATG